MTNLLPVSNTLELLLLMDMHVLFPIADLTGILIPTNTHDILEMSVTCKLLLVSDALKLLLVADTSKLLDRCHRHR